MNRTMNLRERELFEAPGLARPDLIPEGINDELDELRAEHVRLLAERDEAAQESFRLAKAFKAEDEARKAAWDAEVAGEEVDAPEVTPPEARALALAPVRARLDAVNRALVEHGGRILDTVEEHHDDWLRELDAAAVATTIRVEEALQVLAEAVADEARRARLERWIDRLAGDRGTRTGLAGGARWSSPRARLEPFPDFMASPDMTGRLEELKNKLNDLAAAKETTTDA